MTLYYDLPPLVGRVANVVRQVGENTSPPTTRYAGAAPINGGSSSTPSVGGRGGACSQSRHPEPVEGCPHFRIVIRTFLDYARNDVIGNGVPFFLLPLQRFGGRREGAEVFSPLPFPITIIIITIQISCGRCRIFKFRNGARLRHIFIQ